MFCVVVCCKCCFVWCVCVVGCCLVFFDLSVVCLYCDWLFVVAIWLVVVGC